jgi:hypothetical protein
MPFPPEQHYGITVCVNTTMTQELYASCSLNVILDSDVRNECHVGDITLRCGGCTVQCYSGNAFEKKRRNGRMEVKKNKVRVFSIYCNST